MKRFLVQLILVLLFVVLSVSCGPGVLPDSTKVPSPDQPDRPDGEPYPAPVGGEPVEIDAPAFKVDPYPKPDDLKPVGSDFGFTPIDHEYAPAPGDDKLHRGNVFIEESGIIFLESLPVQVRLQLLGNLPTPCHQLRAIVSPPDDQHRIQVEIYSLTDPEKVCTQVLQPFNATIPLGGFIEGSFLVYVNGGEVGSFKLP